MNTPLKGACIFGQSGGPSSVINASAYGVIKTALDSLAKENPWAFEPAAEQPGTGVTVSTGGEHGAGGSAGNDDGVAAAFASLNPTLKL